MLQATPKITGFEKGLRGLFLLGLTVIQARNGLYFKMNEIKMRLL